MKFSEKQIEFFKKLEDYYRRIKEVSTARCKPCGACVDCCYHITNYLHSPLEIDYANYHLLRKGNPDNLPIYTWKEHMEKGAGLCVYCDQETKGCKVYEERFNICRIYGPYISDTDLTSFPGCVYKFSSVQRAYGLNLVPYNDEYEELVKGYMELVPEDIREIYDDINTDLFSATSRKRYEYAAENFKELIEKYPHISYLYACLGRVYRNLGNMPLALEYFRKALEVNPQEEMAHYDMGAWYYQQNMPDRAEEEYRAALSCQSDDSQARYNLVFCLVKQKKLAEASQEFKKLLDESFKYEERLLRERELVDLNSEQ